METSEELHKAAIAKIKAAFPKNRRIKRVARPHSGRLEKKEITNYFDDKRWDKLIDDEWLVYNMSEVDFGWLMTDQAYLYYLPALLIAILNKPTRWDFEFSLSRKIGRLLLYFRNFPKRNLRRLPHFLRFS